MDKLFPWQHQQWERFVQSQAAGRLAHALLLTGSAGLGKRVFAEQLVQAVLCQTPMQDGASCGYCRDCRLIAAGSHPDFVRVEPKGEGTFIRVDQVRELSMFLGHTSQFGGYKVALLMPADALNVNAANSLLKTLEEPPPESLLIMVTAFPSKLRATLRSRCQNLVFRIPSKEQTMAWLGYRLKNDMDLGLLLNLAGGAPLAALAFAEGERLEQRRELFKSFSQVMSGQVDPVVAADLWVKGDMSENLHWLVSWHMDMIRLKMVNTTPQLANMDLREPLQRLAAKLSARVLFGRLDDLIRLYGLTATSVNPQFMIEAFFGSCVGE